MQELYQQFAYHNRFVAPSQDKQRIPLHWSFKMKNLITVVVMKMVNTTTTTQMVK